MLAAVALARDGYEATTANARKRAITRAVKAKIDDPADILRPSTRRVVEKAVLDLITEKRSPALEKVSVRLAPRR